MQFIEKKTIKTTIIVMAIKKDQIGTTHYSKILDRNVLIKEGPTDDFYKLAGLSCVLEDEKHKVSDKMGFPKTEKLDSNK